MKIKYITFLDTKENLRENRTYSPACKSVSEYMVSVMNDNGFDVDIISPIGSNNDTGFYNFHKNRFNKQSFIYLPCSCGNKGIIRKVFHGIMQKIATVFFPLLHIERNDVVLVYHSAGLSLTLLLLKMLKKCTIILQVEEIYGDVDHSYIKKKKENKCFNRADAFIFATKQLESIINLNNKPYCILNGIYSLKNIHEKSFENNNFIKCVYAGTFNMTKGGAVKAIETASYLDQDYQIHIVGFGTDEEVRYIQKIIEESNSINKCQCYYDGMLLEDDLDMYIQKCDIGLCTQDSKGEYNMTSFPSKIFMYLTNGLPVVSTNTPVIIGTEIEKIVHICEDDSPEKIAHTILTISNDEKHNVQYILESLDCNFRYDFKKLIHRFYSGGNCYGKTRIED